MSLRRKVTGALAWVGLVIVVAVPAAELVSSRLVPMLTGGASANKLDEPAKPAATPAAEPAPAAAAAVAPAAESAAPAPAVVAAKPADEPGAASNDTALDEYLSSGRTLPGYLTPSKARGDAAKGGDTPAAAPPATTSGDLPAAAPAATPPAPASAKPAVAAGSDLPRLDAEAPAETAPAAATPDVAAVPAVVPVPLPAKARPKPVVAPTVTEDEFRGWKSGSLEDYLKQQGLLSAEPAANH